MFIAFIQVLKWIQLYQKYNKNNLFCGKTLCLFPPLISCDGPVCVWGLVSYSVSASCSRWSSILLHTGPLNHLMTPQMGPAGSQRAPTPVLGTTTKSDRSLWAIINRNQADSQNYSHLNCQTLIKRKGLFVLDQAGRCPAPLLLLGLWETSFCRTRCRQPVWQSPPEPERKELLIILVTTGGRHTHGFLWGRSAPRLPAPGVSEGDNAPQDRLGPRLSPLVLCGFTIHNFTPSHIPTSSDYFQKKTLNKQGKDVGGGGHSWLSVFW